MNVALLIALAVAATTGAEQRRPMNTPAPDAKVRTEIALKIGAATSYAFSGQAVCQHLSEGSIYDTPAERWSVIHRDEGRSLNLTLWRPRSGGGAMTTFDVTIGGTRYRINTVRAPQARVVGSATVTFAPQGTGGTFTINGTSDSGAKISGTIRCDAFTVPAAVAGE